jgi:hypothetical protein
VRGWVKHEVATDIKCCYSIVQCAGVNGSCQHNFLLANGYAAALSLWIASPDNCFDICSLVDGCQGISSNWWADKVGVAHLPTLCCPLCQVEDLSYLLSTEQKQQGVSKLINPGAQPEQP